MKHSLTKHAALAVAAILACATQAASQTAPLVQQTISYTRDSGPVSNTGTSTQTVISFPIVVQGAPWMRLEFDSVQLSGDFFAGTGAILRVTSAFDGDVMELNEFTLRQWQNTTGYFNGDTLIVEIEAKPGTGVNRVAMKTVWAGVGAMPDSQCGPTDDRVPSTDKRTARLLPIGCTGWLIDDCGGCFLTAGHCTGGSLQVVQFNVPNSTPSGNPVNPPISDQYSVDPASVQTNGGQGVGNDYAYYGTFPNTTTGKTALTAQGAAFTLSAPPAFNPSQNIRITGYGVDSTPATLSQTNQTHAGPWVSAPGTTVSYRTDTEGGNSGSPVIHDPTGLAIGIHTHGGCTTAGTGQNNGTLIIHSGLQNFLNNPKGVCVGGLSVAQPMPTQLVPNQPTNVFVQASGPITPGSAMMHYRYDGGTYINQTLVNVGGSMYQGTLPPATCADAPQWYFSANSTLCGTLTLPPNAPTSVYSATVPPEVAPYCVSKPGLACGTPTMNGFGTPSASASSGFFLIAGPARSNKSGLVIYGNTGPNNAPFQGGTLCVNPPVRRTTTVDSGGTSTCDGEFALDMNAFASGSLGGNPAAFLTQPGTKVHAQFWGRDTIATGSFLSNGVAYSVCP